MNCRFERKLPRYEKPDALLIWHPSQRETYYDVPRDSWCRFRRTVTLDGTFRDATVKIFADSRYLLYVNGVEVATGPCQSDPRWQYYDEIDLPPYLQAGDNVIAALVLYFGYGTGQSMDLIIIEHLRPIGFCKTQHINTPLHLHLLCIDRSY